MPRRAALPLLALVAGCAAATEAPLSDERSANELMSVSFIQSGLRTSRTKAATDAVFNITAAQPDLAGEFEGLGRRIATAHAAAEAALSPGPSAANITGVVLNTIGDSYLFTSALFTNSLVLLTCMVAFCVLRPYFPLVYDHNRRTDNTPELPEGHNLDGFLGWMYVSWNLSTTEIERVAGLDAGMLVEFCNLCMRLLAMLLLPMVVVVAPLHWIAGHDDADDVLSQLGMANLPTGSALYWVHALVVWYVVVITQYMIFQAKADFVPRRARWLKGLEAPRATTVLVEGIPARLRSDALLLKYFADLFPSPGSVRSAYVVRDTTRLVRLKDRLDVENLRLTSARFLSSLLSAPVTHQDSNGSEVDSVRTAEAAVRSMEEKVARERAEIENAASVNDSEVFTSNGFVTFGSQQTAALALAVRFTKDIDELVTSVPPAPEDVNWRDLLTDRSKQATGNFCGQALILGLFWLFMPIVVLISSFTNLDALRFQMPLVNFICSRYPQAQVALESVLATLALTLFMSLLPSVLMFIFHQFFRISSHNLRQHELQIWYFWFLIIFVVLVTAIGSSLLGFVRQIAEEPLSIFRTLAVSMPSASHFYLSWMVMQWATHGTALARFANLFKFMGARPLYDDEKARALSEPEDQDYYGMGGRSARFTLNMVIALVYCSLTPLIVPLTILNFAISRLIYSYLFAFTETRKPDLGGVFYVTQLEHIQHGLLLYVVLMIGILAQRAPGLGPMLVVAPCLVRLWFQRRHIDRALQWEALPYEEVPIGAEDEKAAKGSEYRQPELFPLRL